MEYTVNHEDLRRIRSRLERNARLFDRPDTYTAGVEDTVAALVAIANGEEPWLVVELPEPQRARMI